MPKYILRNQMNAEQANSLAKQCNISQLTAGLLLARGVDAPHKVRHFLQPSLSDLSSPFSLSEIESACKLINDTIAANGRIVIYADYDADGVSAAAILYLALKQMGTLAECYIPNRKDDGYGLSIKSLKEIKERFNPSLIVTVDCGITAIEEIAFAKGDLGIEVIVTDHHKPQDALPSAICINPHLTKDYTPLCGAGVALKLAEVLIGKVQAMQYLDICAIATIADMVPLVADNRIIASFGLKMLSNKQTRIGIRMLIDSLSLKDDINSYDIAFKIAPRLNAVGRLDSAYSAFRLLVSEDRAELALIVKELELANTERQQLCESTFLQAKEKLKNYNLLAGGAIILEDKDWDSGIVGIVAAKICEEFRRPTILLTHQEGLLKGSARSVNGVDIFKALQSAQSLLESFGGHSMAAGVSVEKGNLKALITTINKYFKDNNIDFITPVYYYDSVLDTQEIDLSLAKEIEALQPFGLANPNPVFLTECKKCNFARMGNHNHILCRSKRVTLLGFNMLDMLDAVNNGADILYSIKIDFFRNTPQINGVINKINVSNPPNAEALLVRYLELYNIKNFNYKGVSKEPQNGYGHLVVAYTKDGYDKACVLYPEYSKNICALDSLNPINTILLSPSLDIDYSYFGRITFADILPDTFAQVIKNSYGKVEHLPNATFPNIQTSLDIQKLRQNYLIMKKLLTGKQDNLLALHKFAESHCGMSLIDFCISYNIFKQLLLICTDKNDIIYFRNTPVEIDSSTLYAQIVKEKMDYAEIACDSEI